MNHSTQNGRSWPIIPPGIWLDVRRPRCAAPRPALFLDRDGVIVRDAGYLSDPARATLIPQTTEIIKAANECTVPVLVVTNQSGIDRGLFGWDDFAAVERRIAEMLAAAGAATDATAACPFHPDHTAGYDGKHDVYRKPRPGMITALANALNIELAASWLVGDQPRDIEAACSAGLAGGILIGDAHAFVEPTRAGFIAQAVSAPEEALGLLIASGLLNHP